MNTHWRTLFFASIISCALAGLVQPAFSAPIDLNTWSVEGNPSNGNWVVAADGSSVLQTTNGQPTFFVSPNDYTNTTFDGKFTVETNSDDDFIGFVFGYRSPLSTNGDATNDFETLLFDWKKSAQTFGGQQGPEGFTLSRLSGLSSDTEDTFWGHADTSVVEVLATDYGAGRGWESNTTYDFSLLFQDNRIKIDIGGGAFGSNSTIFDIAGSFVGGRFGFYNYSQSAVRYQGFTEQETPPPSQEIPEPASLLLLGGGLLGLGFSGRRKRGTD